MNEEEVYAEFVKLSKKDSQNYNLDYFNPYEIFDTLMTLKFLEIQSEEETTYWEIIEDDNT